MFKKGKWYKGSDNSYRKCAVDGQECKYSEIIINNKWNNSTGTAFWKVRLATQEEIQQYLPDNHPDKIKVTQDEFKVGDWVVVTSWYYANIETPQVCKIVGIAPLDIAPYKIKLNKDHYGNKHSWNFKLGEFRKAKLEEIPVKDLSNEEILEIAKQYYPIGTKFKCVKDGELGISIKEVVKSKDENRAYYTNFKNNGFNQYVYYKGKWAEIISTSQEAKDDFVLPEKWFIKVTKENKQDCNRWREFDALITEGKYMHNYYSPYSKKGVSLDTIARGYTEITTEQFKKYVLGEKSDTQYLENYQNKINNLIGDVEYEEDTNEIYIPTITKQKKKIDYTINSVFADIKVNLPEKPKKIVKPIVLEKFNLII